MELVAFQIMLNIDEIYKLDNAQLEEKININEFYRLIMMMFVVNKIL